VREYYNLEELWADGRFDKPVNSSRPAARIRKSPRAARRRKAA